MDLDAKICYCFHVSKRKIINFIRREQPRVASQIAECGGAGTGCGWCIPFLRQMHQESGDKSNQSVEQLSVEEYARGRAAYIRNGGGKPPAGATPLPDEPPLE